MDINVCVIFNQHDLNMFNILLLIYSLFEFYTFSNQLCSKVLITWLHCFELPA